MADDVKDGDDFFDPDAAPKDIPVTEGEGEPKARDAEVIQHPSSNGSGSRRGAPIDDQEPEEETQGELFQVPAVKGKAFDLKDVLATARRRNIPVEYSFKMSGKAIPAMSSLMDPFATSHLLLADCVVDSMRPAFIRDGDRKVEKVVIYCELKPFGVADALSEQGQVWLREKAAA
jgi:hypothetical protein